MNVNQHAFIAITDLYKAYRKAKSDAYHDKSHFSSLAFAKYEQHLEQNLKRLHRRLSDPNASWSEDIKFIGGYSYLPKSLGQPRQITAQTIHFATLDPLKDWENLCSQSEEEVLAEFRLIMTPTVDYQIVSALWLIKVGHKYDRSIDRKLAYAHELRRVGGRGEIAMDSHSLFVPYMGGYRRWRSRGLDAMRNALNERKSIAAVTMDIRRFYHRVSPQFLVRRAFLSRLNIALSADELIFTDLFIKSIDFWYAGTPDFKLRPDGGLPVGLSASRVISNVLLAEFDKVVDRELNAIYYGRYADDIFLVVETPEDVNTGAFFMRWLRKELDGWLVLDPEEGNQGIRLKLPYAKDSEIVFSSAKQKIFFLSGEHGFDLVDQIVEKIKEQSSEYRQLPELPLTESKMVAQALLATPDARLEADSLRKAEAVSIRRLGFSLLLGDVEAYAKDLAPDEWRVVRHKFYGLVCRYVLTPVGYFDYFSYIVRVFGLMIASGDIKEARDFLGRFDDVSKIITRTTSAGGDQKEAFVKAGRHYLKGFTQAAYESASVTEFSFSKNYRQLLTRVLRRRLLISSTEAKASSIALLKADLGRRPYHNYWFEENKREKNQPPLPSDFSIRKLLSRTKKFRGRVRGGLNAPYWPAIAFPTRPIPLWSLSVAAPSLMSEPGGLERAIWATRGSRVNPRYPDFAFVSYDDDGSHIIEVPGEQAGTRKIGVPSYLTTPEQFHAAIKGAPDRSLSRYIGLRRLINKIMRESPDVKYLAFPECSIPLNWALGIAKKLGERGISFVAGIENRGKDSEYTNEALVSLASNYFGRRGAICFIQPKLALAHEEAAHCQDVSKIFSEPPLAQGRPLYVHGGLCFGVLICSDLTTIANRSFFQGAADLLFVLEWNRDITTFEFLIESTAHDLHAPVVQINNREYGDSRIRVPFEKPHLRDIVRVKGGDEDFYVVTTLDFAALREFQRDPKKSAGFKPLPIGYVMSPRRRNSKLF